MIYTIFNSISKSGILARSKYSLGDKIKNQNLNLSGQALQAKGFSVLDFDQPYLSTIELDE
jgi:hypothetical protein